MHQHTTKPAVKCAYTQTHTKLSRRWSMGQVCCWRMQSSRLPFWYNTNRWWWPRSKNLSDITTAHRTHSVQHTEVRGQQTANTQTCFYCVSWPRCVSVCVCMCVCWHWSRRSADPFQRWPIEPVWFTGEKSKLTVRGWTGLSDWSKKKKNCMTTNMTMFCRCVINTQTSVITLNNQSAHQLIKTVNSLL